MKLTEYINCRGPRVHEKSTEAKNLSQRKEFTRIQKGDRKLRHRKRDTASGVSSNKSYIDRAMRVRMLKVPPNFVQPKTPSQSETNSDQQIVTSEVLIAPPPTSQRSELTIPSTSAPVEAVRHVLPRATKRTRKSPKYYGYDNEG